MSNRFKGIVYLNSQPIAEITADDVINLKRNARNTIITHYNETTGVYETAVVKFSKWVKSESNKAVYITSAWVEYVNGSIEFTSQFSLWLIPKD